MDRRESLGLLRVGGAGLAVGGCTPGDGHSKAASDKTGSSARPLGVAFAHFCGIHMAKKDPKLQLETSSNRRGRRRSC